MIVSDSVENEIAHEIPKRDIIDEIYQENKRLRDVISKQEGN